MPRRRRQTQLLLFHVAVVVKTDILKQTTRESYKQSEALASLTGMRQVHAVVSAAATQERKRGFNTAPEAEQGHDF